MIINLSNIILKVNIQISKHFDLNEYFIATGINVQCLYTIMALGHIYTNTRVAVKSGQEVYFSSIQSMISVLDRVKAAQRRDHQL